MNEGARDQSLEPPAAPAAEDSPAPFLVPTRYGDSSAEFSPLTRLVNDPRAITRLLHILYERSGVTKVEIAQSMGTVPQSLTKSFQGVNQPTLGWFLRFVAACGGEVLIRPRGQQ